MSDTHNTAREDPQAHPADVDDATPGEFIDRPSNLPGDDDDDPTSDRPVEGDRRM
jgi:hypothetical protein